MGLEQATNSK